MQATRPHGNPREHPVAAHPAVGAGAGLIAAGVLPVVEDALVLCWFRSSNWKRSCSAAAGLALTLLMMVLRTVSGGTPAAVEAAAITVSASSPAFRPASLVASIGKNSGGDRHRRRDEERESHVTPPSRPGLRRRAERRSSSGVTSPSSAMPFIRWKTRIARVVLSPIQPSVASFSVRASPSAALSATCSSTVSPRSMSIAPPESISCRRARSRAKAAASLVW